ncbi:hypothetical protein [Streptomyces sp. Root369]|nr:hypothetical protein [Streptomyces sp. Root369]
MALEQDQDTAIRDAAVATIRETVEAAPSADVRARLRLSLGRLLLSRGLT